MKNLLLAISLTSLAYLPTQAQSTDQDSEPKKVIINIGGNDGVHVEANDKVYVGKKQNKDKDKKYKTDKSFIFDLGLNFADDNTNYATTPIYAWLPSTKPFIGAAGTKERMAVNAWRSKNVNLTPFSYSFHLYKKAININTGLGFNFYNFSFENETRISNDTAFKIEQGAIRGNDIRKNKIGLSYVTVPLSLQFKLGHGRKKLVVGGGISAGYLMKSWYKLKTDDGSKIKDREPNIAEPLLLNAIGELGITHKIRFYGSYGLNSVFKGNMEYAPVAIGLRFNGL
jgi:opacity protein-like surface antigen